MALDSVMVWPCDCWQVAVVEKWLTPMSVHLLELHAVHPSVLPRRVPLGGTTMQSWSNMSPSEITPRALGASTVWRRTEWIRWV